MERAEAWARSCGFRGDLNVAVPVVEKYPRAGRGYVVQVQEKSGRQMMATAKFTSAGEPSLWTVDGKIGV